MWWAETDLDLFRAIQDRWRAAGWHLIEQPTQMAIPLKRIFPDSRSLHRSVLEGQPDNTF